MKIPLINTELEQRFSYGLVTLFPHYSLYATGIQLLEFQIACPIHGSKRLRNEFLKIPEKALSYKETSINIAIRLVLDHLVATKIMTAKDRDSYMRGVRKL